MRVCDLLELLQQAQASGYGENQVYLAFGLWKPRLLTKVTVELGVLEAVEGEEMAWKQVPPTERIVTLS